MVSRTTVPRRSVRVLAPLSAGAMLLALAACAPSTTATDADTAVSDLFDQELHDLLPSSVQDSGTLTLGALWETPPTIGVDVDDPETPVGMAPEMSALFGEILGVDIEWLNMQWPAQLPGVQSGTVDALFGQVSITAEREQSIVDLVSWKKTTQSLLVPEGNPEGFERLDDLCGYTVAVPIGSNQVERVTLANERCAEAGEAAIQMQEYQGATASIQALRAGTVDAWLNASADQDAVVAAEPEAFAAVLLPEDEVPTEYGGIAVGKDKTGLTEALLGAMAAIVENGSYGEIFSAYDQDAAAITADEVLVNPITGTAIGETAE